MGNEILDEDFTLKGRNTLQAKFVNWISIVILWGGIVYCLINGIITDVQVIAGVVLLIISTITTYFKYEIGVKITLGSIVLGVLSLVVYFPISYSISLGYGNVSLGLEMSTLLIGIVHYFTNRAVLSNFLSSLLNREVSPEELQTIERSKINGYKNRFLKKSVSELEAITNNEKLLPEARKAAKELMEERIKEADKDATR